MVFLKVQFFAKYEKILKGGPFGDKKKWHSVEKKIKGVTLYSRLVLHRNVKNGVNERRALCFNLVAFSVAGPVV